MTDCYRCGSPDHISRDCTAAAKPPADPDRHLLAQHKRCTGCRQIIYEWDHLPCGRHQPLARA